MAQPQDLTFLENDHQAECKPYQAATGYAPIPGTDYKLYYEWFTPGSASQQQLQQQGEDGRQQQEEPGGAPNGAGRQPFRVLGIMGFCCGCKDWAPLVYLLMTKMQHVDLEMAIFDNRGFGQSSVPKSNKEYSTDIMAHDAVAVMDHLGWQTAHVIGLSLGGMITLKVAALHPDRVQSATALSVVAGAKQLLPHNARSCWFTCLGACTTSPSIEDKETINMQFSPATLKQEAPDGRKYKSVLRDQYAEARVQNAPMDKHGRSGQLHAILNNKLRAREREVLRQGKPPVLLVHGAKDHVADKKYAEQIAKRIQASIVLVPGAHLISRENVVEVADAWLSFVAQQGGAPFSSAEISAALKA